MGARTGRQYIKGLQDQQREVWLGGERVKDVTTHPGLANGVRAIAALYDMQHDAALRDDMTYVSPTSGERVGLSFIVPPTREELQRRRVMVSHWGCAARESLRRWDRCPTRSPCTRRASRGTPRSTARSPSTSPSRAGLRD